jgi:hypothetical protein
MMEDFPELIAHLKMEESRLAMENGKVVVS